MQYFAIVLVSPETSEIAQEVARLMEPYELYRLVQPYKEAAPQEEINFLATCFELDPKNLEVMLAEVRAASSFECWIEGGVMFWMTTDNPAGHWDTCRIWTVQGNVWPAPNTPEDFTPVAVIAPDGVWHDPRAMSSSELMMTEAPHLRSPEEKPRSSWRSIPLAN
jgi:hypothetical protein